MCVCGGGGGVRRVSYSATAVDPDMQPPCYKNHFDLSRRILNRLCVKKAPLMLIHVADTCIPL